MSDDSTDLIFKFCKDFFKELIIMFLQLCIVDAWKAETLAISNSDDMSSSMIHLNNCRNSCYRRTNNSIKDKLIINLQVTTLQYY